MTTQLDAARVLTGIIRRAQEAGLPRLTWRMTGAAHPELIAQSLHDTDDDRTAAVRMWADHLGGDVTTEPTERFTRVSVAVEVDGVRVEVFTHTDQTHTYVSVPIEQAGGA